MKSIKNLISLGYLLMALLVIGIMYIWRKEWYELEKLEVQNRHIDTFRQESHEIFVLLIELSLSGETVLEWEYTDLEHYHYQRMAMDSMLCRFKTIYPTERIDSVRHLLEDKERQMRQIVQVFEQQQAINYKITRQVPIIVQKSVQEQPQKPKRKGFLGIFGKKEKPKPTVTTTMLRSLNRGIIAEQRAQSRRLSEHTDSLAARNAELNRQQHGFIRQMDKKVQADLQKREAEITAMREQSFMQIGSLTGFVLLLVISYIIIHRNANRIKRYKQKTTDLIGQLQQSVEQNEALIASRKKAVHTITHELRTPLTAITGYATLMDKEHDTDKAGMYIQNIRQSSERMRGMLNTLLDFFRLDNGKEQPNLSPCRISAITHILETEFMPIAMNKGLTLIVESHTDAVVLTDKERILQICNNLLSNAIKFTDNGNVSLAADYDNGLLKLIVEDTGTGMTDDEQQRIFGAFERLSNAAAKDGFGLGLSIVQRIVAMLGGTIRLESEKGKGSRFTVEIPMQTAGELLPEQTIQAQMRHNHTCHDVIAIDNDEVLLLMLKEMYAHEGMHCDTCTNVAELIELIRKKEYSLLLTDLNMPEINGFELLELLRSSNVGNSKDIPVVVTTASGSCSKEELMERGFAGCLFKPFSISELMEVTDNCAAKEVYDEKPDFSTLLSYGNEAVLLDKLIAETEKEMQAVRDAEQRKDLQELDTLTHHLRSSWQILRTDQPLRELYVLLHGNRVPEDEALSNAVKAVLDKGAEIIRQAKEERRKYENG